MTVASEQKATTRLPLIVPTAASMPESSSGVINSTEPSSNSAWSRKLGLRGSSSRGNFSFFTCAPAGERSGPAAGPAGGGGAVVVICRSPWRRRW